MQSSSTSNDLKASPGYIKGGIEAKGHTPVYKMHRYFARRPYNVFRYLIEFYSKPKDIVLDCFCGGGVTLFESLCLGRRAVAADINPLATFITDCQTTLIPLHDYRRIMDEVKNDVHRLTKRFYSTKCRKCQSPADVRWFELAYRTMCSKCGKETLLSSQNKTCESGKPNGRYVCQNCGATFLASGSERIGYALVSVTYRCRCTTGRQKAVPNEEDILTMKNFERDFDSLVEEYGLWYPRDEIPLDWDRQLEDGLTRKSINRFSDLYTKRSLFFNAYLLKRFRQYKNQISPELYKMLIFTFSAILRYTNNMAFSASGWMDGRPISWDKHAYWIPNQFVEVNPLEYVEKRRNAIVSGLRFQQSKLKNIRRVDNFSALKTGEGTHIIWTRSSESLPIEDEGVDVVITDPPYGSNVQYGELSYYWLVWLRDDLELHDMLVDLKNEILVHRRKQTLGHKNYDFYSEALRKSFSECFRVLKPEGVLVFTFNNKDLRAWYAVIRAAVKAGFHLNRRGVVYQHPIDNYASTSHTRYARSLHGDFIYTFCKSKSPDEAITLVEINEENIRNRIQETAIQYLSDNAYATTDELYKIIMSDLIPFLVKAAMSDSEFCHLNKLLSFDDLDGYLGRFLKWDQDKRVWHRENLKEVP